MFWFLEQIVCGHSIFGPLLMKKHFETSVSCGCLARFKCGHRIQEQEIEGEKGFGNVTSADSFIEDLKLFLDEIEYGFSIYVQCTRLQSKE